MLTVIYSERKIIGCLRLCRNMREIKALYQWKGNSFSGINLAMECACLCQLWSFCGDVNMHTWKCENEQVFLRLGEFIKACMWPTSSVPTVEHCLGLSHSPSGWRQEAHSVWQNTHTTRMTSFFSNILNMYDLIQRTNQANAMFKSSSFFCAILIFESLHSRIKWLRQVFFFFFFADYKALSSLMGSKNFCVDIFKQHAYSRQEKKISSVCAVRSSWKSSSSSPTLSKCFSFCSIGFKTRHAY